MKDDKYHAFIITDMSCNCSCHDSMMKLKRTAHHCMNCGCYRDGSGR